MMALLSPMLTQLSETRQGADLRNIFGNKLGEKACNVLLKNGVFDGPNHDLDVFLRNLPVKDAEPSPRRNRNATGRRLAA